MMSAHTFAVLFGAGSSKASLSSSSTIAGLRARFAPPARLGVDFEPLAAGPAASWPKGTSSSESAMVTDSF